MLFKTFLHYMLRRTLGGKNMHKIEIAYVNKKMLNQTSKKYNRIKRERKHPQEYLGYI